MSACARAPRRCIAGFTLVEMLVALTIFSFIGVAAYQLLSSTGRLQESGEARFRALAGLQAAVRLLDDDLSQFAARPIPRDVGDPDPALDAEPARAIIEFTRAGWRNPLGAARSGLQRVAWLIDDDGRLVRRYRKDLDDPDPDEVVDRVVVEGIEELEFRFLDAKGKWRTDWPPDDFAEPEPPPAAGAPPVAAGASAKRPDPVPRAVEVKLVHRQIGEIVRVVALR